MESSEESITTPATSNNSFATKPTDIYHWEISVNFEGNCLKPNKVLILSGQETCFVLSLRYKVTMETTVFCMLMA